MKINYSVCAINHSVACPRPLHHVRKILIGLTVYIVNTIILRSVLLDLKWKCFEAVKIYLTESLFSVLFMFSIYDGLLEILHSFSVLSEGFRLSVSILPP